MNRRDFLQQASCLALGVGGLNLAISSSHQAVAAPSSLPTSRPLSAPLPLLPHEGAQTGIDTLMAAKPTDIKYRIAVLTDPHFALRDKSFDFKVLRYAPWIIQQHFSMMRSLDRLTGKKVDLLLVPGDLTRDSEPWNHQAMMQQLKSCAFPSLVIPGNHDVEKVWLPKTAWGMDKFVAAYQGKRGGYSGTQQYYAVEALPGLVVIGLNSSDTPDGALRKTWNGRIDETQLRWLKQTLGRIDKQKLILVQIHHPVLHHHPANRENSGHLWSNFHTDNADELLKIFSHHGVPIVFTGHHHINHIIHHDKLPITEICTAGACSYPSNFRVLDIHKDGRKMTVHTVGIPWSPILKNIAQAAQKDTFWRLPDRPQDTIAQLHFLAGRPQDRHTTLPLPPRKHLLR